MKDRTIVTLACVTMLGLLIVSSCNKSEELYAHLNTEYASNTDTIIFYDYNGSGYYDLSGDKEICDYSGNNVYVDTELLGTFVNYYTFQADNINYFMGEK